MADDLENAELPAGSRDRAAILLKLRDDLCRLVEMLDGLDVSIAALRVAEAIDAIDAINAIEPDATN